eukprot:6414810-Amphidinium_carterae.1
MVKSSAPSLAQYQAPMIQIPEVHTGIRLHKCLSIVRLCQEQEHCSLAAVWSCVDTLDAGIAGIACPDVMGREVAHILLLNSILFPWVGE